MKQKEHYIKICPKCGNHDFALSNSFAQIIAPVPDACKKCGYTGLFPEVELNKLKEMKEKLQSKK